jgi:hypothetical protein
MEEVNPSLTSRVPFPAPFSHSRQEAVGQDEARKHRGYVEAVLYVQKPLQVMPVVLVQVAMRPPGDQQPADGEVHQPRCVLGVGRDSAHNRQPEEKKRNPQPEGQTRHYLEDYEERELRGSGSGKSGRSEMGQRMGPTAIAATAAMRVTATTLIQVLLLASPVPLATWAAMLVLLFLSRFFKR